MTNNSQQLDDSKPLVLIIDDAMDVHRLLKARLRTEGVEFISAMSGAEGISTALARQPALIFLDLDMPLMDGFEVLRKLKATPDLGEIPVVVLSSRTNPQDKVTAFDLGAFDYIPKPFTLIELAARMRSALRLHRMVKTLAQRAQIDGLTSLWNRTYFDRRWSEEFSRACRNPRPLSIALIDVDNFKSINDNFGHPAGDSVLQNIATLLSREVRTSDIICRYGGEEFALIMPDTPAQAAASLCERLRSSIQAVVWPKHPDREVTASFGVSGCLGAPPVSAEAWLEIADKNLYEAKRGGRNRVVCTELLAVTPDSGSRLTPTQTAEADPPDGTRLAG